MNMDEGLQRCVPTMVSAGEDRRVEGEGGEDLTLDSV